MQSMEMMLDACRDVRAVLKMIDEAWSEDETVENITRVQAGIEKAVEQAEREAGGVAPVAYAPLLALELASESVKKAKAQISAGQLDMARGELLEALERLGREDS